MRKKIDSLHRITIPVAYLKELGIKDNQELEIEKMDNKIIIINPHGMRSGLEIENMYNNIHNLEPRGEYDKGFEDALKYVLRKENE